MGTNYYHLAAGLFLYFTGFSIAASQSGPEFLACATDPIRLCVEDEGVRLPDNNQIHLGVNNTDATSCSVHISLKKKVKIRCGSALEYRVELFLHDTSTAILLQPATTILTDSLQEAELSFDTEHSLDSTLRANGIQYILECNFYHRIRWIVTDTCGQTDTCDQIIDLFDCHPPELINPPDKVFHVVITLGCDLTLHAVDFVVGILDDCTEEDTFLHSLKEEEYLPFSYMDPCDVPAFGVELPFDIWIADKGRDLDCSGAIEWSERNKYKQTVKVVYHEISGGACLDCFENFYIRGKIETEDQRGVELVHVNLTAQGHVYPTYVTGDDGSYLFQSSSFSVPTTITPSRDDWHKNGVSTLDLVKIQKHLLGIEPFTSPYDVIAADANNSQSVSAIDLIELRKLILGIYLVFPHSPSWKFVRKDYIFGDTTNPWPSPGIIENTNPEGSDNNDFIGIKMGDVNNSVDPLQGDILPRTQPPIIPIRIQNITFQKGENLTVDLMTGEEVSLLGFQFTLSHPGLILEKIIAEETSIAEEHFERFDGYTSFSWFDIDPLHLDANANLLTLHFRAIEYGSTRQSISITSTHTEAEWYDADEMTYKLILVTGSDPSTSLQLFPMQPNPWRESSVLTFFLRDEADITFTSFDASGRKVYAFEKLYPDGYHEITLSKEKFPQEGTYFYNLQSEHATTTGKFVVLK